MNGHLARRAILAASMALPASSVFAQGTADLVGTWRLVSSVSEKDGKTTDQFGTGADGMMSLDANGRFMLTIIGPDLPNTRTPAHDRRVQSRRPMDMMRQGCSASLFQASQQWSTMSS